MISNAFLSGKALRTQHERISPELAAYVRDEWHMDADWIRAQAPQSRIGLGVRLRRWLRARRRRVPETPPRLPPVPIRIPPATAVSWTRTQETCPHSTAESLGMSGPVEFLQCTECGAVLVDQNGHQWHVRGEIATDGGPRAPEGSSEIELRP